MTWPATELSIREELEENFYSTVASIEHGRFVPDYIRVGLFLASTPARLKSCLTALEQDIANALTARLGPIDRLKHELGLRNAAQRAGQYFAGWQSRLNTRNKGHKPAKWSPASHLVTDVLSDAERKEGFTLYQDKTGHPKTEIILALSGPQFRQQLKTGHQFKDPTIGPDHGEFTHRLQWNLIARSGLLKNKAIDVYKKIGDVADENGKFGLWDALCDRVPKGATGLPATFPFWKEDNMDFRCPEALLTWLCQPAQLQTYPLLAGFLKKRKEKRAHQVTDSEFATEYVAKKVFNKPYALLSEAEKDDVAEWLRDGLVVTKPEADMQDPRGLLRPHTNAGGYKLR